MPYHTELRAFLFESLDFIQEKLNEAIADEGSQTAALMEADCAVTVMRRRLEKENEYLFVIWGLRVPNPAWWKNLANMDRTKFLTEAQRSLTMLDDFKSAIDTA